MLPFSFYCFSYLELTAVNKDVFCCDCRKVAIVNIEVY